MKKYNKKISLKCIFWQICNKIVEYQDLYRNKDDFLKTKRPYFLFKT